MGTSRRRPIGSREPQPLDGARSDEVRSMLGAKRPHPKCRQGAQRWPGRTVEDLLYGMILHLKRSVAGARLRTDVNTMPSSPAIAGVRGRLELGSRARPSDIAHSLEK
jgi:hypothetical protein